MAEDAPDYRFPIFTGDMINTPLGLSCSTNFTSVPLVLKDLMPLLQGDSIKHFKSCNGSGTRMALMIGARVSIIFFGIPLSICMLLKDALLMVGRICITTLL